MKQKYVEDALPALSIFFSQNSTASEENRTKLKTLIQEEISPLQINWNNENEWKITLFEAIKSWDTEQTEKFNLKIRELKANSETTDTINPEQEELTEQLKETEQQEQERKQREETEEKTDKVWYILYLKKTLSTKKIITSLIISVLLFLLNNKSKEKIGCP